MTAQTIDPVLEVLKAARDRIAAQDKLGQMSMYGAQHTLKSYDGCTCAGLAIGDAAYAHADEYDTVGTHDLSAYALFVLANDIEAPERCYPSHSLIWSDLLAVVAWWNDQPERDLAQAVAAFDRAIDYAQGIDL